jgi:hypothetical protein
MTTGLYWRPLKESLADWDAQLKQAVEIVPEEEAFDWDVESTQDEKTPPLGYF